MFRRTLIAAVLAAIAIPAAAVAEPVMPSARQILDRLESKAAARFAPQRRVSVQEFKRSPELRRAAPSIDIQSINFAFGSAEIPYSQYDKLERIADALTRMYDRNRHARVLLEGHTDAVGSDYSNQILSERRAASLKHVLVMEFDVPARMLDTVGYGEAYLLVPTPNENWKNRRVTLRNMSEFVLR